MVRLLAPMCVFFAIVAGPVMAQLQTSGASSSSGGADFSPSTDFVENNGLAVRVLFIGKNKPQKMITLSAELKNTSAENIWLAVIGPKPAAVDTSGNTYQLSALNGLAQCKALDNGNVANCISNFSNLLPGDAFASLQSGASSIVTMQFSATDVPDSGFLSLSINVAVGSGQKPSNALKEPRELANVAISFPLISLEDK